MSKLYIIRILSLLIPIFIFTNCASLKKGEGVIFKDATPPPDYNPSFILEKRSINNYEFNEPEVSVSYIDTRNSDRIKVYLHLIDENHFYISGATAKDYENYWCNIYLTYAGNREKIKSVKLSEIIDGDGKNNAIAFAMDKSGSMGTNRAMTVQKAIADLIEKKREKDAFSLIRYDHRINVDVPLSNSHRQLLAKHQLNGLEGYGGFTAIADAVVVAIEELAKTKDYDTKAVMIFTDGYDNRSSTPIDSVIALANKNNIVVFGVDFGAHINPDYVKSIAEGTGGFYRRIYKTDEFALLFEDMYFRLNNAYLLEITTPNYGKHFVEIEICLPKETVFATAEFDNTPDIGQIALLNVYFDFDKATIKQESKVAINKLYNLMKAFPEMKIQLNGHTDSMNSTGDPQYNVKLSQRRADAVKDELIKMGISADRISTKGYGENIPVADNSTDEGRKQNRRTEFVILNK